MDTGFIVFGYIVFAILILISAALIIGIILTISKHVKRNKEVEVGRAGTPNSEYFPDLNNYGYSIVLKKAYGDKFLIRGAYNKIDTAVRDIAKMFMHDLAKPDFIQLELYESNSHRFSSFMNFYTDRESCNHDIKRCDYFIEDFKNVNEWM